MTRDYLTVADVLAIHADQIATYPDFRNSGVAKMLTH